MTRSELLAEHEALCRDARELMAKKNHDYAGDDGDTPFANFEVGERLGIGRTAQGMLFRMSDKFKRLVEYEKSGEFAVENEGVRDTVLDLINYAVLFYAYGKDS